MSNLQPLNISLIKDLKDILIWLFSIVVSCIKMTCKFCAWEFFIPPVTPPLLPPWPLFYPTKSLLSRFLSPESYILMNQHNLIMHDWQKICIFRFIVGSWVFSTNPFSYGATAPLVLPSRKLSKKILIVNCKL